MTGIIVSVFPFRNRVSFMEAFEGLELGEGKLSRPVLRGPGGRKAAWLLGIDVAVLGADPTLSPNSRQSGCRLVKRFRLSVNSLREPKRQEKRLSWASRKTVPLNYHSGQNNP